MKLEPDQEALVRAWAAEGASLSDIQSRLASECGVHLSYMDTRFLLIDLAVQLKERNEKKPEPPSPVPPAAPAGEPGPGEEDDFGGYDEPPPLPDGDDPAPDPAPPAADAPAASSVQVELARIQRPGFAVSGTLVCSDGTKGEWGVDNYGRLALAFPDDKGYRPSAADQQAFMSKLRQLLQAGY